MKKLIIVAVIIFAGFHLHAQVSEGKTTFNKVERTAVIGTFAYSPDIISTMLQEDLRTRGFGRGSSRRGVFTYSGILFPEISSEKIDLYFKLDKANRREPDKATVYLLVSKGYDNFVSSDKDADIILATIAYLTGLTSKFEARKLELDIAKQEQAVSAAEKKYNDAVSATKKLDDKIKDSRKQQHELKGAWEAEQKQLETLRGRKR
jgi:hypothetical protein